MAELYKLPDGWEWKTFDEVSTFIRGITFKPNEKYDEPNENTIICFRTTNIQSELDDRDVMNIDLSLLKSDNKIVKNGDILISSANSLELLGKCCLVKNINYKATLGGFIVCGRANSNILDEKYFYYFFSSESNQKRMRNLANKTTGIANLPIKKVEKESIPIPPLPEQQRLVKKIDSLFEKIDKSIELHQKNIDEANAFMGSVLNEVFGELAEKYSKKQLKDIVDNYDGKRIPIKSSDRENINGQYPYYGASGIIDYVNDYIFDGEYLLISEDGANLTVRKYPIAFIANGKFWVNNHAHIVKAKEDITTNRFMEYAFSFTNINDYITGSAQPKMSQGKMNLIEFSIPPLPIQQKVVEYLDSISEKMEKVKMIQKEKMQSLKALKASLLDQAFRGEL